MFHENGPNLPIIYLLKNKGFDEFLYQLEKMALWLPSLYSSFAKRFFAWEKLLCLSLKIKENTYREAAKSGW